MNTPSTPEQHAAIRKAAEDFRRYGLWLAQKLRDPIAGIDPLIRGDSAKLIEHLLGQE